MVKLRKDSTTLFCGTSERIAKLAPVVGLNPTDYAYLTDVYAGILAFYATTTDQDRFGIVEVDTALLDPSNYLPCEWYLEQTSRQKAKTSKEQAKKLESFRKNLEKYQSKWKDSMQKLGIVVYDGFIPKKAIRKITIYDPASNPTVTQAIVNMRISLADYKNHYAQYQAITRWLMGESVTVEEWLGEEFLKAPKEQKEELSEQLQNKLGLDIFYMEAPSKGS